MWFQQRIDLNSEYSLYSFRISTDIVSLITLVLLLSNSLANEIPMQGDHMVVHILVDGHD